MAQIGTTGFEDRRAFAPAVTRVVAGGFELRAQAVDGSAWPGLVLELNGKAQPGAKLYVRTPAGVLASIYADPEYSSPLSNPLRSDAAGVFQPSFTPELVAEGAFHVARRAEPVLRLEFTHLEVERER